MKSTPNSTLMLKPGDWIERHEQTYYTYYLHPDAKWSDGAPFTSRDLEFTLAALNNPAIDGDHLRAYYQDLVECKALAPHIVRMRYRQQYFLAFQYTVEIGYVTAPWHYFSQVFQKQGKELTLDRLTPQEEQAQNKISAHGQQFGQFFNSNEDYNRAPLGTGPYVVSFWENSDRVELRRNPAYWFPERGGYLDKLIFKFIIDANGVLPALQTGVIDFATRLNEEQYFEVLKGPPDWFGKDFVKADWYTPVFGYVGWNELNPRFQDRRVRIALGMLFDKQRFLESKLHNNAVIVSGPSYYFGPDYDHRVAPLDYSPDTARDLLTEAGWIDSDNDGVLDKDGVKFTVDALFPRGNPLTDDRMAILKNELKNVGIEMNIKNLEWASFLEKVKSRDFDIVTLSWAMDPESDPHQIWHGSGAGKKSRGSNHVSFDNPQADELIDLIRVTIDPKKRQELAFAFHRLVDSEQPYQFLYCPKELGAYHKRFRGVKWYRLRPGYDFVEWYVPKDEQLRQAE
ncbi:MAG: ABC transporter substrate-binding protein [Planctomycetaceae bacterium]